MWSLDHTDGWSSNVNSARNLQRWLVQGKKKDLFHSVFYGETLVNQRIFDSKRCLRYCCILWIGNFRNFVLIMLAFHCSNSTLAFVLREKYEKYFVLIIIWRIEIEILRKIEWILYKNFVCLISRILHLR